MFHNILVAVDGSAHAEKALSLAVDLAKTHRAHLTILTAVPGLPATASFAGAVIPVREDLEEESRTILRRAAQSVPEELNASTVLTRSPVASAVLDQIKTHEFDLLVVGSRGRGAVKATVLGSVSHELLNKSPIPILVVRERTETPHAPALSPPTQRSPVESASRT